MEKSVIVFEREKMMRKGMELLFKDDPSIRIYAYEDFDSEKHQIDAVKPELILVDYDSFHESYLLNQSLLPKTFFLTFDASKIHDDFKSVQAFQKPINLLDLKQVILKKLNS